MRGQGPASVFPSLGSSPSFLLGRKRWRMSSAAPGDTCIAWSPGPGTSVMQVMASDADDPTYGSSARLVYSVLDGEHHFTVDPKTGEGRGRAEGVGPGRARGVGLGRGPLGVVCAQPSNPLALRVAWRTWKHFVHSRTKGGGRGSRTGRGKD